MSTGKLMSADELANHLGITRNAAYKLLHTKGFPSVQIGALLFAVRDEVDIWIEAQARERGYRYGSKERFR